MEARDWRRCWRPSNFFKAFFFSLAFSLFHMGSDFNFAWSVPSGCPTDETPAKLLLSTKCKLSCALTYSLLRLLFGSALLLSSISRRKCCGVLKAAGEAFAILVQASVWNSGMGPSLEQHSTFNGHQQIQAWLKRSPTFSKQWSISLLLVSLE